MEAVIIRSSGDSTSSGQACDEQQRKILNELSVLALAELEEAQTRTNLDQGQRGPTTARQLSDMVTLEQENKFGLISLYSGISKESCIIEGSHIGVAISKARSANLIQYHLDTIACSYDIENKQIVFKYIENNQEVISFLLQLPEQIEKYFPWKPKPKICIENDPDIKDFEELFIYIPYEDDIKKVYPKFKKFINEWFLENYGEVKGLLNVDLDHL